MAAVAALACSGSENAADGPVRQVTVGMPRDSVLTLLRAGSSSEDSLANVYRTERYFISGRVIEILFYSPTGVKETEEKVPEATLYPIVLDMGTVAGHGWEYFDSVAVAHDFRVRPRG